MDESDIYDDDDDVWGEDENCDHLGGFEKSNDFAAIVKDGYRHGKQKTEEIEMQRGFDMGFTKGVSYGKLSGTFYANCMLDREDSLELFHSKHSETEYIKQHNTFKQDLKNILYDEFDVSGERQHLMNMFATLEQLINKQYNNSSLMTLCDQFRETMTQYQSEEERNQPAPT